MTSTQTRLGSLIESLINVLIGFGISLVLPAYGHAVTLADNLQITLIFTIARSYLLRRYFNARIQRAAHRLANQGFQP